MTRSYFVICVQLRRKAPFERVPGFVRAVNPVVTSDRAAFLKLLKSPVILFSISLTTFGLSHSYKWAGRGRGLCLLHTEMETTKTNPAMRTQ